MTRIRVITLFALLGCGYAQEIATLRLPRSNEPLAREQDLIYKTWSSRQKLFLVVGASTYPSNSENVPYVEATASRVRSALTELGYRELATLSGPRATRQNIRNELAKIQVLDDNFSVLVYYAGHALVDTNAPEGRQEVWLQVADQQVQAGNGISISQVIDTARGRDPSTKQRLFTGRLILILDSCFSGQANLSPAFYEQIDHNGVLFTSSQFTQPSREFVDESGTHLTAFGYFFHRGLTKDWDVVDFRGYGYITYVDLWVYVSDQLSKAFQDGRITTRMDPDCRDLANLTLVAYDPARRKNWQETPVERHLVAFQFDFVEPNRNVFATVLAPIGHVFGLGHNVGRHQKGLSSVQIVNDTQQTVGVIPLIKGPATPGDPGGPVKTADKLYVYQVPEGSDRLAVQFVNEKGKIVDSKLLTLNDAQEDGFTGKAPKVGAQIQAMQPYYSTTQ